MNLVINTIEARIFKDSANFTEQSRVYMILR